MTEEQKKFIDRVSNHCLIRSFFSPDVSKFIACQFALESAFGTSKIAKCQNNFCGMKVPKKRCFYGMAVPYNDFAKYYSFDDCLIDYIAWVFYNRPSTDVVRILPLYVTFIQAKNYCPDTGYITSIINLLNSLKDE